MIRKIEVKIKQTSTVVSSLKYTYNMDDESRTSGQSFIELERRKVYDVNIFAKIPNFSSCTAGEGSTDYDYERIPDVQGNMMSTSLFGQLFSIYFYENGDKPENEGYISVLLTFAHAFSDWKITQFSLTATLAIEDVHGDLRYLQYFAEEHNLELKWGAHEEARHRFGLDQYLKRAVILNSSDLLHGDTLKLSCDISFSTEPCPAKVHWYHTFFLQQAIQEEWFEEVEEEDSYINFLKLENKSTPLCTSLQQRSGYFQKWFKSSFLKSSKKRFKIADEEYDAFFDMLCYIRFDTLNHVFRTDDYLELYVVADKYLVPDLKTLCSQLMRRHIKKNTAVTMLLLSDMCNDFNLKKFVLHYIVENKQAVMQTSDWELLVTTKTSLAREIVRVSESTGEFLPSNKKRYNWLKSKNYFRMDRLFLWSEGISGRVSHYEKQGLIWQSAPARQNTTFEIPSTSINITQKIQKKVDNMMQEFHEALLRLKPKTAMEITESIKYGKEIEKTSFDFYT